MSNVPNRRPRLAPSVSTPDIFCRPMDPAPAPLVYINGWNGVGKETVAEYLTLLLGSENSLLVDVRSVGREAASSSNCCGINRTASKHKHQRRHEHHPLLTPEHPRYFSSDVDSSIHDLSPLPSPSFSSTSFSPPSFSSPSFLSPSFSSSSSYSPTISRSGSISSASTASTAATSTSTTSATPTALKPTPPTTTTTIATTIPPSPTATTTPAPAPAPPCSSENLTALLTRPRNGARIAVLPACCPDTAAGRAALHTFEEAAARAGRLFVGVVLCCADGGGGGGAACGGRRAGGGGSGGGGRGGGGFGGFGGGGGGGVGGVGGVGMGRAVGGAPRRRVASVGGLDSVLLSSASASASASSGWSKEEGGGGGVGSEDGGRADGGDGGHGEGGGRQPTGASIIGRGAGGYGEARGRAFSLYGPGTQVGGGAGPGTGMGSCWARGGGSELGLARPTKAGLTVDASCLPPFEVALEIIAFVKGLQAERDAELCSSACSVATTPGEGLESEGKLEAPGVPEGK
ncbi:uncharacterized protein B0H64DRAFT_3113 [Chaetomium fimeti]|uniref:Uncharacterized protein n=1 Tax=Chaetomium fimeti TaxID=1854472 RepID=A0AAE0HNP8_9PEZI|nr:hypothetical protein B0H64DRAFT_3113 [Chaetomium fimeti]